jgi:hypothetical protein
MAISPRERPLERCCHICDGERLHEEARGCEKMGLILKIAAGVLIGMLLFQVMMLKSIDAESEHKGNIVEVSQQLRNKVIMFMNFVHSHYKTHHELPTSQEGIDCNQFGECAIADREFASRYYFTYRGEWISIEPYLNGSKVFFDCSATMLDRLDERFHHCTQIEKAALPAQVLGQ